MKNILKLCTLIILILQFQNCKKFIPGKVNILSVENLTHNSMVVFSEIKDIQSGVGLQFKGICLDKYLLPTVGNLSYKGSDYEGSLAKCLTGISGLEPDTRYIIRAYFETNEGIVFSDTLVIKTKPVDFMTDSRDGKKYPYKIYGNQVWMVQNLDYQTPGNLFFENNVGKTPIEFGRLYNYQEANGVCPPGWRLPSDEDWKVLEETIGISKTDLDKTALRGSPVGGMMKEPGMKLWDLESALHSNNKSGFSVVPSGWYRRDKKEFTYSKTCAGFWTVSDDSKTAFLRFFYVNSDAVSRTSLDLGSLQLSVRCVRN
jgi:uncharacterized protein (TIGR02145 family)